MKTSMLVKKVLTFSSGLFIMAFGVALSVKANLGVSPISCVPYIYSLHLPFTLGELTILFNTVFVIAQIILLRKKYRLIQLIQLPAVIVFGYFIDFALYMVSGINPPSYNWQVFWCLLSCIIVGLGVFLEVKSDLTYLPGEGIIVAISDTFQKEFGKIKIGFDSSLVLFGTASSFILLHRLEGIREGTIVAALLIGYLVKLYSSKLPMIDVWLGKESLKEKLAETIPSSNTREKYLVITISREYGSRGHEIGQYIAKNLGISFYDKKLINLTAEQSDLPTEYVQENEQKLAHSLLHELYGQNYAYVNDKFPPKDMLFLVQSKIIRTICEKESCVIVGRCANFILKNHPNCFNVFIHADKEHRKSNIRKKYGVTSSFTDKKLAQSDHERANYCLNYTGKNWNDATNYHMTIDSSLYGPEKVAQKIIDTLQEVIS